MFVSELNDYPYRGCECNWQDRVFISNDLLLWLHSGGWFCHSDSMWFSMQWNVEHWAVKKRLFPIGKHTSKQCHVSERQHSLMLKMRGKLTDLDLATAILGKLYWRQILPAGTPGWGNRTLSLRRVGSFWERKENGKIRNPVIWQMMLYVM